MLKILHMNTRLHENWTNRKSDKRKLKKAKIGQTNDKSTAYKIQTHFHLFWIAIYYFQPAHQHIS